jgi:hypothetical protein
MTGAFLLMLLTATTFGIVVPSTENSNENAVKASPPDSAMTYISNAGVVSSR